MSRVTQHTYIAISLLFIITLTSCDIFRRKDAPHPNSFSLVAVGDISHPRTSHYVNEFDVIGAEKYAKTSHFFKNSDLAFANLETPYTDNLPTAVKQFSFSSKPKELEYIVDAGINLISLANNHSADAGVGGITDTINLLEHYREQKLSENKQRVFLWAGTGTSPQKAREAKIFSIPGRNLTIAFLAYGNNRSQYVNTFNASVAQNEIQDIRANYPDAIIIVSVHSGTEYIHTPQRNTQINYRTLIDAGAQLILGHHPHVAQGIEHYKEGIICYSLGNYSFGSRTDRNLEKNAMMYGMLNSFQFVKREERLMVNLKVYPLYTDNVRSMKINGEESLPADFVPYIPAEPFAQKILRSFKAWSNNLPNNKIDFDMYSNYMETNITLRM